jgi:hypothetical protein
MLLCLESFGFSDRAPRSCLVRRWARWGLPTSPSACSTAARAAWSVEHAPTRDEAVRAAALAPDLADAHPGVGRRSS